MSKESFTDFKIALFGDCYVGKSSITISFTHNYYIEYHDPTIEDTKKIKIENQSYFLAILDTVGSEEYRVLRKMYMICNQAFVLVYSITSKNSFSEIQTFHDQICKVVNTYKIRRYYADGASDNLQINADKMQIKCR
jgi:GTPase KRas